LCTIKMTYLRPLFTLGWRALVSWVFKIIDLDTNQLPVQVCFTLHCGLWARRTSKLKMDEKYTWNLTWQHKEVGLRWIHGETKKRKIIISCQVLFHYLYEGYLRRGGGFWILPSYVMSRSLKKGLFSFYTIFDNHDPLKISFGIFMERPLVWV
jgi:hypothetical protein